LLVDVVQDEAKNNIVATAIAVITRYLFLFISFSLLKLILLKPVFQAAYILSLFRYGGDCHPSDFLSSTGRLKLVCKKSSTKKENARDSKWPLQIDMCAGIID